MTSCDYVFYFEQRHPVDSKELLVSREAEATANIAGSFAIHDIEASCRL